MSKAAASLRLDRLLSNLGYGSRREVQLMVDAGRVVLDGGEVEAADGRIALTGDLPDRMRIDGKPLDPLPGLALMLNKPVGVTSTKEPLGSSSRAA